MRKSIRSLFFPAKSPLDLLDLSLKVAGGCTAEWWLGAHEYDYVSLGATYDYVIQGKSIKINVTEFLIFKTEFEIFTLWRLKEVTHVHTILRTRGRGEGRSENYIYSATFIVAEELGDITATFHPQPCQLSLLDGRLQGSQKCDQIIEESEKSLSGS